MEQVIYDEKTDGMTIDRIRRPAGFTMPSKHFHNDYEIYYLVKGERYYFIERQTYHVTAGSLVFIGKNQIHQTSQSGSGSHERILIGLNEEPFGSFLSVTGELSLSDFFTNFWGVLPLKPEEQAQIESFLSEAAAELRKKKQGCRHVAFSCLSRLFCYSLRLLSGPDARPLPAPLSPQTKHRIVDEAASYIAEHCTQPLSLEAVAGRFFVSKCYLSRIFKEATGFTVNEYINMNRIKQARQLLTGTDKSITEISQTVGYDSLTYFERVFQRYNLSSPGKYRSRYKDQLQPVRPKFYHAPANRS